MITELKVSKKTFDTALRFNFNYWSMNHWSFIEPTKQVVHDVGYQRLIEKEEA